MNTQNRTTVKITVSKEKLNNGLGVEVDVVSIDHEKLKGVKFIRQQGQSLFKLIEAMLECNNVAINLVSLELIESGEFMVYSAKFNDYFQPNQPDTMQLKDIVSSCGCLGMEVCEGIITYNISHRVVNNGESIELLDSDLAKLNSSPIDSDTQFELHYCNNFNKSFFTINGKLIYLLKEIH